MALFITGQWHVLKLFAFGICFMCLRWEGSSPGSTWKYCNMNFKAFETCVFTKGSFDPNASFLDLLFFPKVHTMTWKLMAKIHLAFWNLPCNSHMKSAELYEIKTFFHLFFQLKNVLINQSSSNCVWWKVKTKLIFLFFFLPHYFSNKIRSNFKEFNIF